MLLGNLQPALDFNRDAAESFRSTSELMPVRLREQLGFNIL